LQWSADAGAHSRRHFSCEHAPTLSQSPDRAQSSLLVSSQLPSLNVHLASSRHIWPFSQSAVDFTKHWCALASQLHAPRSAHFGLRAQSASLPTTHAPVLASRLQVPDARHSADRLQSSALRGAHRFASAEAAQSP
jgi:hypothetical protein